MERTIIQQTTLQKIMDNDGDVDKVRYSALKLLSKKYGRNIITYYTEEKSSISSADMLDFMNCVHRMNPDDGLDLILHVSKGEVTAVEAIARYLQDFFNNDIRIIIPEYISEEGTLLALSGKSLYMDDDAVLGTLHVRDKNGYSYNDYRNHLHNVKQKLIQRAAVPYFDPEDWKISLSDAIKEKSIEDLTAHLANDFSKTGLLSGSPFSDKERVFERLTQNPSTPLSLSDCKAVGLPVHSLQTMSDYYYRKIMTIHYSYLYEFEHNTEKHKWIEKHFKRI